MSIDSTPPPPPSSGNAIYGIVGVVLIGAAIALWFGMKGCEDDSASTTTEAAVEIDAGQVERQTGLGDDELLIPEVEPDAGPQPDAGSRVRYVTRYVGGGGGRGNWSNCRAELEPAAARRVLAQSQLQFRNCYERRLKVNQTLEGRVVARMRVGRNGSVTAVQTGGSLRDSEVLSCVRSVAQRLDFPNPTGGTCTVVEAPFNFTPRR